MRRGEASPIVRDTGMHTCYDSGMITDDLSVTGCRYRGWIIVPIAKYEIIRGEESRPSIIEANDGRLSAARPFITASPGHHPLPIPIASPPPLPSMSHCSYIGRNRPLPLITSCPSRPRLRGPGIKRINGARVSPPPSAALGRSLPYRPSNDSINRCLLAATKDLGYRSTVPVRLLNRNGCCSCQSFSISFLFPRFVSGVINARTGGEG